VPPRYPVTANALGLRVAWFVYRGAGKVTFDPEQVQGVHRLSQRITLDAGVALAGSARWEIRR